MELSRCIKQCSGHIKQLDLSKNRIGDEGFQHILKAIVDSQIEEVSFTNNKITDKGVDKIYASLRMAKHVKLIDLTGNGIANRLLKNKLKSNLPSIDI